MIKIFLISIAALVVFTILFIMYNWNKLSIILRFARQQELEFKTKSNK